MSSSSSAAAAAVPVGGTNMAKKAMITGDFPPPTAPTVLIPFEDYLYALPLVSMKVNVEFHVSTAFVRIDAVWRNAAAYQSDCLFVLPLTGTVTKVNVRLNQREYATAVIPRDLAQQALPNQKKKEEEEAKANNSNVPLASSDINVNSYEQYIPNRFRLPIPKVSPNDEVVISAMYIEPLSYRDQQYQFHMPLTVPANLLSDGLTLDQVLKIECTINSIAPNLQYDSSYLFEEKGRTNSSLSLVATGLGYEPGSQVQAMQIEDFRFAYSMSSQDIMCVLFNEPAQEVSADGTFCLFVTPPMNAPAIQVNRKFIFLLDRSGSMSGQPYQEAIKALSQALDTMNENDLFNVICFDHNQTLFKSQLTAVNAANKEAVLRWAEINEPTGGGTDIKTPLEMALRALNAVQNQQALQFVMLITDGCVDNERLICQEAEALIGTTRILSLGIGFYCNWFFLRMLSQIGRGFSEIVVYREFIERQVLQLVNMARIPILTNVNVLIPGTEDVELYPHPVPDLCLNAPLTVCGKYRGNFPNAIVIEARTADGKPFTQRVMTRTSDVIPVNKVFIKQRLEILTAKAWLKEKNEYEQEAVDLSCRYSMPCPYTTMVAYQRTNQNRDINPDEDEKETKQPWYRDSRKVASLGVGGAVAVGAALFSFGDALKTLTNAPGISMLADLGFVPDAACCDCCGCDCCDVGGCASC